MDITYRTSFDPSIPEEAWQWSNLDDFLYHTDIQRDTSHRDEVESLIYEMIHSNRTIHSNQLYLVRYRKVKDLHDRGELASIPPHPDSLVVYHDYPDL